MSCGAHLRGLAPKEPAPKKHGSGGDTASDLTCPGIEPQVSVPKTMLLTTELNLNSIKFIHCAFNSSSSWCKIFKKVGLAFLVKVISNESLCLIKSMFFFFRNNLSYCRKTIFLNCDATLINDNNSPGWSKNVFIEKKKTKLNLLRISHKSPVNPTMQLHVNSELLKLGTQTPSFRHGLKEQGVG